MFALFRHDVDAGEEDLTEVDVGELVVAIVDAAQSLDASRVTIDRVAGSVGDAVQHLGLAVIRLWRRDKFPVEFGGQRVHLIAFVSEVGE